MRPNTPTGNQMDLGNLSQYWQLIDQEFARLEQLPPLAGSHILSARAFDESQPAGPRTYMGVTRYLNVARDNHEALLSLLRHHGATPWAPWSLLRPTFETSFLAAWILDPGEGRERRARGLRCEVLDSYEKRKHLNAFKAFPEVRELIEESDRSFQQESLATYKAEAASLGYLFDKMHQKIIITNELPRLSAIKSQRDFGPMLEGTWRLLSGFEHGLGWALLSGTDREIDAHIPGGASLRVVIKDEQFVNAAKSTYFLLLTACRLLFRRHTEPN